MSTFIMDFLCNLLSSFPSKRRGQRTWADVGLGQREARVDTTDCVVWMRRGCMGCTGCPAVCERQESPELCGGRGVEFYSWHCRSGEECTFPVGAVRVHSGHGMRDPSSCRSGAGQSGHRRRDPLPIGEGCGGGWPLAAFKCITWKQGLTLRGGLPKSQ